MKRATDAGSISRQEAVSMVPPLFMDVQPHHRVGCAWGMGFGVWGLVWGLGFLARRGSGGYARCQRSS
jgi:hypothetical protein